MKEESNNQNDKPKEEQQRSDDDVKVKYREISEKELKQVLEDHKKWVESDGKEGNRADLSKTNLQEADLSEANLKNANLSGANLHDAFISNANLKHALLAFANLQGVNSEKANLQMSFLRYANLRNADLYEANLQNADLYEANLQNAMLSIANLQEANLSEANLQEADLETANLKHASLYKADMQNTVLDEVKGLSTADIQYANLENATGLLGNEFAQADVTGTKLPDDIKEFKALENVKETSQNARKIFFAMLLGCVYSWLTIATTTDVRLLTNTASSPLPIIGTEIPIEWFYIAAPLVLLCLFFYFHLYLDNLWKGLASLPAIFPDGKPIDQIAYPWLLNSLVNRHFTILKKRADLKKFEKLKVIIEKVFKIFKIQKAIYIRPLIFYLKEWITIFLAWWVVPITMMAFWLRYIPRHDWLGTCLHIGLIFFSVAFAIYFYRLCALTLQGKEKVAFRLKEFWGDRRTLYGAITIIFSFMLILFSVIGFISFGADFREKDVSIRPDNYWEISEKDRLNSVSGANLKNRNLKNADMVKAFLVKADLRYANLQNADLWGADLQHAILQSAKMQNANLVSADLRDSKLDMADLQNAEVGGANFQNAKLANANLQNAIFIGAKLQNVSLTNSDLQNANFVNADLQNAILVNAKLQNAKFDMADLQNASFEMANLQNASLTNADLQNAILVKATLKNANLVGANLQNASFEFADLTGAKNLTIDQLSKVKTLYEAKLDPELMKQVKKCCPHLLEKPKEETEKTN